VPVSEFNNKTKRKPLNKNCGGTETMSF